MATLSFRDLSKRMATLNYSPVTLHLVQDAAYKIEGLLELLDVTQAAVGDTSEIVSCLEEVKGVLKPGNPARFKVCSESLD